MRGPKPQPSATPEQIRRIEQAKISLGLKQKDLARLVGCSPGAASQWFRGGTLTEARASQLEDALTAYAVDNLAAVQSTHVFTTTLLQKIEFTTWATKPDEAPAQGKKGGK